MLTITYSYRSYTKLYNYVKMLYYISANIITNNYTYVFVHGHVSIVRCIVNSAITSCSKIRFRTRIS